MPLDRNENKTEKVPEASTFVQQRLDLAFNFREGTEEILAEADVKESYVSAEEETVQQEVDKQLVELAEGLGEYLEKNGIGIAGSKSISKRHTKESLDELTGGKTGYTLKNTQEFKDRDDNAYFYKIEYYFLYKDGRWTVKTVPTSTKNGRPEKWQEKLRNTPTIQQIARRIMDN